MAESTETTKEQSSNLTQTAPTDDCDSGVHGIPRICVLWPCYRKESLVEQYADGFWRCSNCGSSYGPVSDETETDKGSD